MVQETAQQRIERALQANTRIAGEQLALQPGDLAELAFGGSAAHGGLITPVLQFASQSTKHWASAYSVLPPSAMWEQVAEMPKAYSDDGLHLLDFKKRGGSKK